MLHGLTGLPLWLRPCSYVDFGACACIECTGAVLSLDTKSCILHEAFYGTESFFLSHLGSQADN
jgi:hypothetical protein